MIKIHRKEDEGNFDVTIKDNVYITVLKDIRNLLMIIIIMLLIGC